MANVLGTISATVVAQRALDLVFTMRPMLKNITLDLSDDVLDYGQALKTRTIGLPTVSNFGTGPLDTSDTDVSVTLDKFKEVYIKFGPTEMSGTKRNLVEEHAQSIAVSLANSMVDAVAGLWLAANYTNSTIVASGWTYANTMVKLKTALNGRGVPAEGRFFVTNSTVYDSLLGDQYVVSATVNPNNAGAIKSGQVPPLAGFSGVYEYPGLPTTGNMVGFAGTKDSVVLVNRVPRDPSKLFTGVPFPGVYEVVTDANTGLSILLNVWQDPVKLELHYRVCWMYGIAVGNPNNGQILKTA